MSRKQTSKRAHKKNRTPKLAHSRKHKPLEKQTLERKTNACLVCGHTTEVEVHCKQVCLNCGAQHDCSDF